MEIADAIMLSLNVLLTVLMLYLLANTDSSEEVFDKLTQQVKRKGRSRARIERIKYAVIFAAIVFILVGGLKNFYYNRIQRDIDALKEKVFYLDRSKK